VVEEQVRRAGVAVADNQVLGTRVSALQLRQQALDGPTPMLRVQAVESTWPSAATCAKGTVIAGSAHKMLRGW
jgi:hypothetical protein